MCQNIIEDFKTVILSGESPRKVQKTLEIQAFKVLGMKKISPNSFLLSLTFSYCYILYVQMCISIIYLFVCIFK